MGPSLLSGRVVVITGAASGIGRALALQFAEHGCRLALADVDEAGLAQVSQELRTPHRTWLLDVSDRAAVSRFAGEVVTHFGSVHVVINNAGVSFVQNVEQSGYEDFDWLMGINFWGVIHGTKAFLPYLKTTDAGWIVNISSVFGLIGFPHQAAYNASKFAVRGFTEALRHELEDEAPHVQAICVHPGGIRTAIMHNARFYADPEGNTREESICRFEQHARTSPEQAARIIVDAVIRRRPRVLIGGDARFIDIVQRLLPMRYWHLLRALFLKKKSA